MYKTLYYVLFWLWSATEERITALMVHCADVHQKSSVLTGPKWAAPSFTTRGCACICVIPNPTTPFFLPEPKTLGLGLGYCLSVCLSHCLTDWLTGCLPACLSSFWDVSEIVMRTLARQQDCTDWMIDWCAQNKEKRKCMCARETQRTKRMNGEKERCKRNEKVY